MKQTRLFPVIFVLIIVLTLLTICLPPLVGIFPFGPEEEVTATVTRAYVDISITKDSDGNQNSASHYMVGTDKGVFEVDNSLWLWKWNADEVYASLEEGKTYRFTTKGRKVVNFLLQEYPRVIRAEPVTNQVREVGE